jgi:hypothetical protein
MASRDDKARGDGENTALHKAARAFREELLKICQDLLNEALGSLPSPAAYRHRARAKAESRFIGSVFKSFPELRAEKEAAPDAA